MKKALGWFSLFSFLFGFGLAAQAADDKPAYGMQVGTIVVPAGLNEKEIQRGIMEGGASEDFIVKSKDDNKVVLYREDGKWVFLLTFVYDTGEIQIYSKTVRAGEVKNPERQVKALKKVILQKLNTTAVLK
jgi:hypothetical protein